MGGSHILTLGLGDYSMSSAVDNAAVADLHSFMVTVGSIVRKTAECSVDISALTLEAVFEPIDSPTDTVTVADGSITKSTVYATFAIPAAVTTVERNFALTIREVTSKTTRWHGRCFVSYAPLKDA